MITTTMTVEEWLIEELCLRGLRTSECEQALAFAKRKLDASGISDKVQVPNKQGRRVLMKDCWNTPAAEYTQEVLDELRDRIEHRTFDWLVNQLRSRL